MQLTWECRCAEEVGLCFCQTWLLCKTRHKTPWLDCNPLWGIQVSCYLLRWLSLGSNNSNVTVMGGRYFFCRWISKLWVGGCSCQQSPVSPSRAVCTFLTFQGWDGGLGLSLTLSWMNTLRNSLCVKGLWILISHLQLPRDLKQMCKGPSCSLQSSFISPSLQWHDFSLLPLLQ